MAQFANLPDDCASCAWLRNQQDVCRSRKSLILFQGNSPVQLLTTKSHYQSAFISHGIDQNGKPKDYDHFHQHNQVNLYTFDLNVTRFLAKTFPNVDTLIVVHDGMLSQNVNKPLLELVEGVERNINIRTV